MTENKENSQINLTVLRGRDHPYETPYGLAGLIRQQREDTPTAIAVVDAHRQVTYTELDLLSDRLAVTILEASAGRRGAVTMRMARGVDMLVAMLGILKAGCYYVPIAIDEPDARVQLMVDVVQPLCWIVSGEDLTLADTNPVVAVPTVASGPFRPLPLVADQDPINAMFTSGSTGKPKAVLVSTTGLVNRLRWMADSFSFSSTDRVLQKTPYTFDVSGWELWVPVISGGRCVFAPEGAHQDPRHIESLINSHQITACHFVPSMLKAYLRTAHLEQQTSLRMVLCSGEELTAALAADFIKHSPASLHNLYGPTEASIEVTHWLVDRDIDPSDKVPIGAPIDNVDLCVVNDDDVPLLEGHHGELWIGGPQIAQGYVGDPDLTQQAFVTQAGKRWYRTGDLAYIQDGLVYYLGRLNEQVKVRGVRVEPGEVEAVLHRHPAIDQVVVVPIEDPTGSTALTAVAVAVDPPSAHTGRQVLTFAAQHLPQNFVPREVIWVDYLPVSSTGKADRRRVAEIAAENSAADIAGSPHEAAQDDLAHHWWRTLPTPAQDRDDQLGFLHLGGHSLSALHLLASLAEAGYDLLPPSVLLSENLSLSGLRDLLGSNRSSFGRPRDHSSETPKNHSALTPAQESLWVHTQGLKDPSVYNVVGTLHLRGTLDEHTLKVALSDVTERHDALRARIVVEKGLPSWVYDKHANIPVHIEESGDELTPARVETFVVKFQRKEVSTDCAPLILAGVLYGPGHKETLLTIVLHHLIADQRSLEIVLDDLATAYTARARGANPIWQAAAPSFSDVAHQASNATQEKHDLDYWEKTLRDAPAHTSLPFQLETYPKPEREHESQRATISLGPSLSKDIDQYLTLRGHTPATFLIASVASVISSWSAQPAVTVGMPMSQRWGRGRFNVVGHMLATVPLRIDVGANSHPDDFLRHVRDRRVKGAEHATPGLSAIARRLGMPLSLDNNPLFQVWINDLTRIGDPPHFGGIVSEWIDATQTSPLFDVNFYLQRRVNKLNQTDIPDEYRLQCVLKDGLFPTGIAEELVQQVAASAAHLLGSQPATPTQVPDPQPPTLKTPFADLTSSIWAIAEQHPDRVAVVSQEQSWTYRQLQDHAQKVSTALSRSGVLPTDVVYVLSTRTPSMLAVILGVWAAGAVLALGDGDEPPELVAEKIEMLKPRVVLRPLRAPESKIMNIEIGHTSPRKLEGISHVLFTSGTSGRAAAVKIGPVALASTIHWYSDTFTVCATDRVAFLAGLGHDPLFRDVLPVLNAGGTVLVPPQETIHSPRSLFAFIRNQGITVLNATPALLEMLVAGRPDNERRELPQLRLVVSAGAPLNAGLARAIRAVSPARLINAYGSTETPQIASCHEVAQYGQDVPNTLGPNLTVLDIGAGVGGARLTIHHPNMESAPVGVAGEIVVHSAHLAAGYLGTGRPGAFDHTPGAYHTGDRGRWNLQGAVVPDGRLDRQISLDGHRVDPEQIERAALKHPGIHQALVQVSTGPTGPALTLHVVPSRGAHIPTTPELRQHLLTYLPRHCVPGQILVTHSLTTNSRHKVTANPSTPAPPQNERDKILQHLTKLVHENTSTQLSPDENFFKAGLRSVTMLHLQHLFNSEMGINLPMTAMFEHPTLQALTGAICGSGETMPATHSRTSSAMTNDDMADQRLRRRQELKIDLGEST